MRYVRLVAVCDEYDTDPGLVVKGTVMSEGMAADRDGTLVAHDLLEHQNGVHAIGPIDDELEALGGVWQVRGRWGDMVSAHPSRFSAEENIASDIIRMARDLDGAGWWPRIGKYRTRAHDEDEAFECILQYAREGIPKELDGEEMQDFPLEAYLENALHLMRRGYRKAERRFGERFQGINLFKAIKDAVNGARPEWEGQEFILGYGEGEASLREVYEEA
jgi:hypothetical protein